MKPHSHLRSNRLIATAANFIFAFGFLSILSAAERDASPDSAGTKCDVLVYGATPGGITAAVSAARLGHKVILAEFEDHLGGIVSNGLTNADIGKKQAVAGIYSEFRSRVRKYYAEFDRENPARPNLKACHDGYLVEAGVAERVFNDMVRGEGERIELRLRHELKEAIVENGRLKAVVLEDRSHPGSLSKFIAEVFVDATYEGDLAAAAKAPYRTGRENRGEYGEPHAGRVYIRHGEDQLLPGSTGEGDSATEAYCFRFHVTNVAGNLVPIEKPQNYNRDDYRPVLEDIRSGKATKFRHIIQVIPMPNGKFELNSDHPHADTGVPRSRSISRKKIGRGPKRRRLNGGKFTSATSRTTLASCGCCKTIRKCRRLCAPMRVNMAGARMSGPKTGTSTPGVCASGPAHPRRLRAHGTRR